MGKLTRRLFVGSTVTAAGLAGASLLACNARSVGQASARYERLEVVLHDMVDPQRIGRAFRDMMGPDRLHRLAAHNAYITDAMHHDCPATRRLILRTGIQQDFAARKTILCERFVLSETECIVAGLCRDLPDPESRIHI